MIPFATLIEKATEVVRNGHPTRKLSDKRWTRLKSDLDGLYPAQRNLVVRLVEQMKATNREDMRAEKQARKNGS